MDVDCLPKKGGVDCDSMRMGSTSFELFKVGLYLTVPAGCVWMFNQEGHKKWWTSKVSHIANRGG